MDTLTIAFDDYSIQVYQSREEGIPVVLLPGLGFSADIYLPMINSQLGERYRLLAIDLPGNGKSPASSKPAEDYSMPGLINLLKRIVSRLFAENAVFIGHSLSGHLLIEGFEDFPWARGFCLVDTPLLTVKEELTSIYNVDKNFYNLFDGILNDSELRLLVSALSNKENHAVISGYLKQSDYKCRKFFSTWILNGEYINEKEAIRHFPSTIALFAGENDPLINLTYLKNIKSDTLWRKKMITIPNAKHIPQLDNPEEFIKVADAFLFDLCGM